MATLVGAFSFETEDLETDHHRQEVLESFWAPPRPEPVAPPRTLGHVALVGAAALFGGAVGAACADNALRCRSSSSQIAGPLEAGASFASASSGESGQVRSR